MRAPPRLVPFVVGMALASGCARTAPPALAPAPSVVTAEVALRGPTNTEGAWIASIAARASRDLPTPIAAVDVTVTTKGDLVRLAVVGASKFEAMARCMALARAASAPAESRSRDPGLEALEAERRAVASELAEVTASLRDISMENGLQARGPVKLEIAATRSALLLLDTVRDPADVTGDFPPTLRLATSRVLAARAELAELTEKGIGSNHPDGAAVRARLTRAEGLFREQMEVERRFLETRMAILRKAPVQGDARVAGIALLQALVVELERPGLSAGGLLPSGLPLRMLLIGREVQARKLDLVERIDGLGENHPERRAAEAGAARANAEAQRDFELDRMYYLTTARALVDLGRPDAMREGDSRPDKRDELQRWLALLLARIEKLEPASAPSSPVTIVGACSDHGSSRGGSSLPKRT